MLRGGGSRTVSTSPMIEIGGARQMYYCLQGQSCIRGEDNFMSAWLHTSLEGKFRLHGDICSLYLKGSVMNMACIGADAPAILMALPLPEAIKSGIYIKRKTSMFQPID